MIKSAFILSLLMLLAACSSEVDELSPELRYEAQQAYGDLTGPCERESLTKRRKEALADLASQFSELEQRTGGTLSGIDFALAKQMNRYELGDGFRWQCGWHGTPDSQLDFDHEKRRFGGSIKAAAELANQRLKKAEMPDWVDVDNAAKFREIAGKIFRSLDPLCPRTIEQDALPASSPARQTLRKLEAELSDSPYGRHLEVAEADTIFFNSVTAAECSEPLSGPKGQAGMKEHNAALIRAVHELETLAKGSR